MKKLLVKWSGLALGLVAGVTGAQEAAAPPPMSAESLVAMSADQACGRGDALCAQLKAFLDGATPCAVRRDLFSVGYAYVVEPQQESRAVDYLVLRLRAVGGAVAGDSFHLFPDNESERVASEALIEQVEHGRVDPSNLLVRYIDTHPTSGDSFIAHTSDAGLLLSAGGAPAVLRQNGGRLLYAAPGYLIKRREGIAEMNTSLLFAVLPAPPECR